MLVPLQTSVKALSQEYARRFARWLWRWETLAAAMIFAGGILQIFQYIHMAFETSRGLSLSWALAGMLYMGTFAWITIFPKGFGFRNEVNLHASKFLWPAFLSFAGGFGSYAIHSVLISKGFLVGPEIPWTQQDNVVLTIVVASLLPIVIGYKKIALDHPMVVGFLAAALMAAPVIIMAESLTSEDGGITWLLLLSGLLAKAGRLLEFGVFKPINEADSRVRKVILTGEGVRLVSWLYLLYCWLTL